MIPLLDMEAGPFETSLENARYERATDLAKNAKGMLVTAYVPNASAPGLTGRKTVTLRVNVQGGFRITGVSGRALGPVNASGVRVADAPTSFPAAGCGTLPASGAVTLADRGVRFTMSDANGREYTCQRGHFTSQPPPVDVITWIGPGYGFEPFIAPLRFDLWLTEGSLVNFNFENQDAGVLEGTPLFHRVDILLQGERYVRS